MSYAVTVDTSQPEGAPALDPLQRAGVVHLLREGLDAIESIEDEHGQVVEITDHFIGVHPNGALLKVFVDAPRLEDAEAAVEAVIGEVLRNTELLAQWAVDKCEVELHVHLAEESLHSDDSHDSPAAEPEVRAAAHRAARTAAAAATDGARQREDMRAAISALAPKLAGVPVESFGHLPAEDLGEGKELNGAFVVSRRDAELAAGALVHSIDILIDELFEDITALDGAPNAAECDDGLLQLEGLPARFAHLYTPLFARKLLVTAVTLTDRLCRPGLAHPVCIAEELLLRLLLETAEATLDLHGLLHRGVREALDAFRANLYEDLDHESLYDPSLDGIDEDPAVAAPGNTPMGVDDWFTPFDGDGPVHPYVAEA
jgi:hypothetical protein